ncbi:ubiquitin domain-containing protein [Tieghemostelium lacteum]|uniref:Ubiquitin domain-containing protein n=1 Tax=Tieghemostelium lacteum TaxID=361077 RepID=A0A151ZHZ4_TIELA|nr:ubiquitin domain-containing protein [Tieghemostelium lacteum]|eukprot:KYQ93535.1 ubiquitin domain-containing protein [Tieghemostelium lacteum]
MSSPPVSPISSPTLLGKIGERQRTNMNVNLNNLPSTVATNNYYYTLSNNSIPLTSQISPSSSSPNLSKISQPTNNLFNNTSVGSISLPTTPTSANIPIHNLTNNNNNNNNNNNSSSSNSKNTSTTVASSFLNSVPPVRKKYKPMQRLNIENHDLTVFYGWVIILCTLIFFIVTSYCLVFSKLLPDSGNRVLDFIKHDWYYCLLIPALVPVTIITVYFNWLSLKFFRHN